MTTKRTYTDEFKEMITELVSSGKAVKEISSEYSINESVIRRWVRERKEISIDNETITIKEMKELKKQNAKLREEVEILKKAMAIFATK